MLDFFPSLLSLFSYGANTSVVKKAINEAGRYKTISYVYLFIVILVSLLFLISGNLLEIPHSLIPLIFVQVAIGTVAIIVRYKALEIGRASVHAPLLKLNVILVFIIGIFFLGESPSVMSVLGASLVMVSSTIIALEKGRLEKGVKHLAITIILWGVYFSMLKIFVEAMGALQATLVLEAGIMVMVWAYYLVRDRDLGFPEKGRLTIMLSGLLATVGAYAYNLSVAAIGVALTGAIVAATPVLNAVFARLILQEKLSKAKYLAIVLSMLGMVLVIMFK